MIRFSPFSDSTMTPQQWAGLLAGRQLRAWRALADASVKMPLEQMRYAQSMVDMQRAFWGLSPLSEKKTPAMPPADSAAFEEAEPQPETKPSATATSPAVKLAATRAAKTRAAPTASAPKPTVKAGANTTAAPKTVPQKPAPKAAVKKTARPVKTTPAKAPLAAASRSKPAAKSAPVPPADTAFNSRREAGRTPAANAPTTRRKRAPSAPPQTPGKKTGPKGTTE